MSRKPFLILQRDNFACFYCGSSPTTNFVTLTMDHLLPVTLGGTDHAQNIVTCCNNCNSQKGAISLLRMEEWQTIIKERNRLHNIPDDLIIDLMNSSAEKRSKKQWDLIRLMLEETLERMEFGYLPIWEILSITKQILPEYVRHTNNAESVNQILPTLELMIRNAADMDGIFNKAYIDETIREFSSLQWHRKRRNKRIDENENV